MVTIDRKEIIERTLIAELGAAKGNLEVLFLGTWRTKRVVEAMAALNKDDIAVTNKTDKDRLIPLMEKLENLVMNAIPNILQ